METSELARIRTRHPCRYQMTDSYAGANHDQLVRAGPQLSATAAVQSLRGAESRQPKRVVGTWQYRPTNDAVDCILEE